MASFDWAALQAQVEAQFRLPVTRSAHAPDHWHRVGLYGKLVGERSGADLVVVRLFALLHDSQRHDESRDPEHGPRAAGYAQELELGLADEQLKLLVLACRDHERGYTSANPTIGTCWDADRLDLDRVLIDCEARYMSTEYGRRLGDMRPFERQKLAGIRL